MKTDKYNLEVLNKIDLFFQLFNNMTDLVYLTKVEKDGLFSYVLANEPAKNFSRLTDQSFGKPLAEALPDEAFRIIDVKYKQAIAAREPITYEDNIVVSETHMKRMNYTYAVGPIVFNQDGVCTHLLAVVRDITERKERECIKKIDKFKVINDTLGHDIGDELLKEFSKRVKGSIREQDLLARIGGDEFGILMTNVHNNGKAIEIAERVLTALRYEWVIEKKSLKISSSIGISFYSCPYEQDEKTLLKQADIALYKAKEKGRDNYQVYTN